MADDKKTPGASADHKESVDKSRRRFVKNSSIALGGVVGGSLLGGFLTREYLVGNETDSVETTEANPPTEARMFFSRYEDFVVLEQATERIYPEDENGPGAIELGVPYFIDKQLANPWGINGRDYRQGPFVPTDTLEQTRQTRGEVFIEGLRRMNQVSQERFQTSFDTAEEEQQIEILQDFADGNVEMKGVASNVFFNLLRMTTLEGVYADPMYGGNRNMAGWKMKEFPGSVASYADVVEEEEFINMEPISLTDYQQKTNK